MPCSDSSFFWAAVSRFTCIFALSFLTSLWYNSHSGYVVAAYLPLSEVPALTGALFHAVMRSMA